MMKIRYYTFRQIAVNFCILAGLLIFLASCRQSECIPTHLELQGDLKVHDPVIIQEDDTYYVFSTSGRRRGGLIPIRCSTNLTEWTYCGNVFDRLPEWIKSEVPGARGIWAPDISYFNDRYHLYYSVSTFGRNNSAIGLVTNVTLDPESPDYKWIDHSMVVRSTEGVDDFNAIDANIAIEDEDTIWLSWGSFWSGIKMRKIDPETGMLSDEDTSQYSLSSRPRVEDHRTPPVEGAVEAPFIIKHEKYWYLFVSFDFCCRGAESTYHIVVGRSEDITGPYIDKDGKPMLEGGGSLVLKATTDNWKGPGHCAVLQQPNQDWLVFHAYHGQTGRSALKIASICWEDGWPRVAELP